MPSVGETKTITYRKSKSALQSEYDYQSSSIDAIIDAGIIGAIATGIALILGADGDIAIIIGGFAGGAGSQAISLGIEGNEEDLRDALEEVKLRNANGIQVKQQFRYTYMSGSGTGWYVSSAPRITYY